jgi:hypothetical protein
MRKPQGQEKAQKAAKEKLKTEKLNTPFEINSPQHSQSKLSSLDGHYHISSLNHPISKESNQLCAHTLPLW